MNAPAKDEFVKKKMTAGICGILLGSLGVHRFVLGDAKGGIIRIVISVCTCGATACRLLVIAYFASPIASALRAQSRR